MDFRNCPECGRVFTFVRSSLCPACHEKDEEQYKTVRNYLARNLGSDIRTVSEATGVAEERIIRFLREGRIISASHEKTLQIQCELCGKLISKGRYCEDCAERLTSGLKRAINEENKKTREEELRKKEARMYTAELRKKRED